jgi:hypothetical protein
MIRDGVKARLWIIKRTSQWREDRGSTYQVRPGCIVDDSRT